MVSGSHLVDVCARAQKSQRRFHVSFTGGKQESREATVSAHEVRVGKRIDLRSATQALLGRQTERFPVWTGLPLPGWAIASRLPVASGPLIRPAGLPVLAFPVRWALCLSLGPVLRS